MDRQELYTKEKRAGALIIQDKKVLLVSDGSGVYWTPGGRLDNKETYEEALIREVSEELNVAVTSYKKYFSYSAPSVTIGKKEFPETDITYFLVEIEGSVNTGREISDLKWCGITDVNEIKLSSNTLKVIIPRLISDKLI